MAQFPTFKSPLDALIGAQSAGFVLSFGGGFFAFTRKGGRTFRLERQRDGAFFWEEV